MSLYWYGASSHLQTALRGVSFMANNVSINESHIKGGYKPLYVTHNILRITVFTKKNEKLIQILLHILHQ